MTATTAPTALTYAENVASFARDAASIATVADLSLPVTSCPGWDLRGLVGHLGQVHRMALAVVSTGALEPPRTPADLPPSGDDDLRAYYRSSADALVAALREKGADAPAWNFLRQPAVTGFWARRMANEHAVHRFDAESAQGSSSAIAPSRAVDGIDEYFLIVPRALRSQPDFTLGGSVHLHCTDTDGEWTMIMSEGAVHVTREHGKGDAAIRATASDLLLGLWGRLPLSDTSRFAHFGDPAVIAALASIGGN